jgi:hypothetical protein
MTPAAPFEALPPLSAGLEGHAARVQVIAYAPGTPPGARAAMARAARAGATIAATRRARRRHHAPPYPVPVATWCGRAWPEDGAP